VDRIRELEGEIKAISKFAYAEQSKAYKSGAEVDETEAHWAVACAELQTVKAENNFLKPQLDRARCNEEDLCRCAKRSAIEVNVLRSVLGKFVVLGFLTSAIYVINKLAEQDFDTRRGLHW
jgi:hypothetical protein